jgi:hypothetical protein
MKVLKKHWPLVLGSILALYFLIDWGRGWIPGMSGEVTSLNTLSLVVGIVLLMYGNVRNARTVGSVRSSRSARSRK